MNSRDFHTLTFQPFYLQINPYTINFSYELPETSTSEEYLHVHVTPEYVTYTYLNKNNTIRWNSSLYKAILHITAHTHKNFYEKLLTYSEINEEDYYKQLFLTGLSLFIIWYYSMRNEDLDSSLENTSLITYDLLQASRYPLIILRNIEETKQVLYQFILLFIDDYYSYFKRSEKPYDINYITSNLNAQIFVLNKKQFQNGKTNIQQITDNYKKELNLLFQDMLNNLPNYEQHIEEKYNEYIDKFVSQLNVISENEMNKISNVFQDKISILEDKNLENDNIIDAIETLKRQLTLLQENSTHNDNDDVSQLQEQLDNVTEKLTLLQENITHNDDVSQLQEQLDNVTEKLTLLQENSTHTSDVSQLQEQLDNVTEKLTLLQENSTHTSDVSQLQEQLDNVTEKLTLLQENSTNTSDNILKEDIDNLKEKIKEIQEIQENFDINLQTLKVLKEDIDNRIYDYNELINKHSKFDDKFEKIINGVREWREYFDEQQKKMSDYCKIIKQSSSKK